MLRGTNGDVVVVDKDRVAAHVTSDVRNAVRALANAAATAQVGRVHGSGEVDEYQLWFLVRALCHEHGMDLAGVVERAEHVAQTRMERAESEST